MKIGEDKLLYRNIKDETLVLHNLETNERVIIDNDIYSYFIHDDAVIYNKRDDRDKIYAYSLKDQQIRFFSQDAASLLIKNWYGNIRESHANLMFIHSNKLYYSMGFVKQSSILGAGIGGGSLLCCCDLETKKVFRILSLLEIYLESCIMNDGTIFSD